ncbi:hypothetical protein B0H11DRAFT_2266967 [Mycena galericulata]|nr:hypothetical protein B0H11DRAFT_2266967 [Mycena galericulata]
MSPHNECRAIVVYVVLPIVLSWLSEVANQSIRAPLLYQPSISTLMDADLNKGEHYAPLIRGIFFVVGVTQPPATFGSRTTYAANGAKMFANANAHGGEPMARE